MSYTRSTDSLTEVRNSKSRFMRELTSFSNKVHAERLAGFLATKSIHTRLDDEDDQWVLWIVNDDDRTAAEAELSAFLGNPDDPRYVEAAGKNRELEREAVQKRRRIRRREIDLTRRWSGSWWHAYPATYILIGICVAVAVVCTDFRQQQFGGFGPALCNNEDSTLLEALYVTSSTSFVGPDGRAYIGYPRHVYHDVLKGEFWRPITPIFLHFGVLHLLFNMMWLRSLGSCVEFVRGTRRFLTLVVTIAVISNVAQFYVSGPHFGGMSGVVFGLIGYVWMKGRVQPELGLGLSHQTIVYAFLWLFLCMSGSFGPIANTAHVGGLIVGVLIGARKAIWRRIRGR
ncbi:MAG: rhomboid family intramembrane serine protease [Planctomycetaceae bacterium]